MKRILSAFAFILLSPALAHGQSLYRNITGLLADPPYAAQSGTQNTHSNTITWTASPSAGVTGYYVYRSAGACGAAVLAKLITTAQAGLSYTDAGLPPATTYCYAVTSTNGTAESALNLSATVQVTTPETFSATALLPPPAPTVTSQ